MNALIFPFKHNGTFATSSKGHLEMFDLTPSFFFYAIVGLSNLSFLFTSYVSWRQYRVYCTQKKASKEMAALCTAEEFEKSRLYGKERAEFGLISGLFDEICNNLIFLYLIHLSMWSKSGQILHYFGWSGEAYQSAVFVALTLLMGTVLGLPLSYYSTFHIEQKHGFNKQTIGLWIKDKIKGVLVALVITMPCVVLMMKTIQWAGQNFYFAAWILSTFLQFFMILIYPTFIQPLFNKFEPLADGELKTMIENLAGKLSFPLSKIFVMDGSTRSSHSNAYFFGLFNKRIVLFDTLLEQMDNKEICAVLGHELGHWSCWHLPKRLAIAEVHIFAIFYLFSKVIGEKNLYEAFGFHGEYPIIIGFTFFQFLLHPLSLLLQFLVTWQSRSHEFEADRFAHKLGYGKLLQSGLVKLHAKNKAFVDPDPLYSVMNYSHPPLTERLAAIRALDTVGKKKL